ncbi:MAG: hypothetical protein Kow0013_02610 [Pararhodobacter sp.]
MKTGLKILLTAAMCALAACTAVQGDRSPAPVIASRAAVADARVPHPMAYLVLTRAGPAEGQTDAFFAQGADGVASLTFLSRDRGRLRLVATCERPARIRPYERPLSPPAWTAPGHPLVFDLEPRERRQTVLDLAPGAGGCALTVNRDTPHAYTLSLRPEVEALPRIARIDAALPACVPGIAGDPLVRAFLATGAMSATCPVPLGAIRALPDGLDALNARVEALTGRALSRAALESGDADMPLDWSRAPQLDLIYVNYLNLNADFAGYLMARMLAFHAARGTIVRILVSSIMLTETDRRLFEGLAARFPTVQIQPYLFPAEAAEGLEGQLGRLHRVTHVKLFATIAREPGQSRALIGGRNMHEGYYFAAPRDLSAWPFLHQYNPEDSRLTGGFTAYEDFEIEFRSDQAVRTIVGHMAALWHRDHDSQRLRPAAETRAAPPVGDGMMRHFLSVPFADETAQIGYFAGLIDAAQHSIHIAIPYLNLPPALDAALRRARARGVSVEIVTTVRVREATDFIVTGLNRTFANEFGDWVDFVDYDPYPRLLHAKLFVFDGRLTIVSSTNLNQRSFYHDMENGVAILDRATARQVDAVIRHYRAGGERVTPGQPVPRLVDWLRRVRFFARAF